MATKPTLVGRLDGIQQANRPASFLVGVYRKYGDDRAGRLTAVIAYYGFFSVFPALLALVTILGFVLQDNQSLREDIREGVIGQLPVIGDYVSDAASRPVTGNTAALVIGVVTALWAGMAAMQASQDAMNIIWDVPRRDDPSFFAKRARSLLMLVVLGGLLLGGSLLTQVVSNIGGVNVVARAVLFLGTLALNIAVLLVGYRVLTAESRPWRDFLPGAVVAGVGYQVLQLVGQLYVNHVLKGAQDVYGTFATVIGLLSWLYLLAQNFVIGGEINVVAAKRLWPRPLTRTLEKP